MGIANSFFEQQGFDKVINEIQRSLALSHTFKPPNDSESHWIQIHLVAKHSTLGWNQEKTIRIPCKQAASFDRQNIPHQWTCQPHPPRPAWFPRGSGRKWPGSIWHSHIMGITGVGSLFAVKVQPERPCVQCGQIRWYQSSWPQLFLEGEDFRLKTLAPGSFNFFVQWFWTFFGFWEWPKSKPC